MLSIDLFVTDELMPVLLQVTPPADDGDELCAFNSFQFWRTPLPALDLSLLDSQSTTQLNEDSSRKDATEEMEA